MSSDILWIHLPIAVQKHNRLGMPPLVRVSIIPATCLVFLFVCPKEAQAYIDPGSGSYLIQLLVGLLFGLIFALKRFWRGLTAWIVKTFSGQRTGQDDRRD